jgi:preprotein translocase subunit YajC
MSLCNELLTLASDWLLAAAPPLSNVPSSGVPAGAPVGGGPAGGPPPGAGGLNYMMPMMLGFLVLFIVLQVLGGRKQRKQRDEMMAGLRKHDRVRMLGGIIGTIAEIHDSEVVVKVDEATNTRIRFAKDAVQAVIAQGPGGPAGHAESAS